MSSFEKAYYEAERFWEGEGLMDEHHLERYNKTIEIIPEDVNSLADVGCGNGIFVNLLAGQRPGLDILGIDRSEAALKFVKTSRQLGDINALSLESRSYDCVSCLEVIEHLPVNVYENALNELCRVAKSYVIVSTPFEEILEENYTQCPGCKSQFNADMHLHSYGIPDIQNLLKSRGFECVSYQTLGERKIYKGHYLFRKLFYPGQFRQWRSPICPVCGYQSAEVKDEKSEYANEKKPATSRSLVSYLTALPKLVWPKEKKCYWVLALYKKL